MTREDYLKLVDGKTNEEKQEFLENILWETLEKSDYQNAEVLSGVLTTDFASWKAELILPELYYNIKKYERVIEIVDKVIAKNGVNIGTYTFLMYKGAAYIEIGRKEGSLVPYAQEATMAYATCADAIKQISQNLFEGKLEGDIFNNFIICLTKMAYIYYEIGMYESAFKYFDEAWHMEKGLWTGYYLAKMFMDGLGTEKDTEIAKILFEQVAECNDLPEDIIVDAKKQLENLNGAEIVTATEEAVKDTAPVKKKSIFGKISDVGTSIAISISHIFD